MSRPLAIALAVSVVANAALAVLLFRERAQPRATVPVEALCKRLPTDLDFFIEGLEKNNDPFYTPIITRTFEPTLMHCLPEHADRIKAAILELRGELLQLVGANVPADAKRAAHDNALRLFRELRGMFGVTS
jgi:hypothetical protein